MRNSHSLSSVVSLVMKKPKEREPFKHLLVDEESWSVFLESALSDNPGAAESLARLLFAIKEGIESGSDGRRRAINTLGNGISQVYQYTEAYQAGMELYLLSLGGNLKPWDEPLQLINGAVERGKAEVPRPSQKARRKRRPGSIQK